MHLVSVAPGAMFEAVNRAVPGSLSVIETVPEDQVLVGLAVLAVNAASEPRQTRTPLPIRPTSRVEMRTAKSRRWGRRLVSSPMVTSTNERDERVGATVRPPPSLLVI